MFYCFWNLYSGKNFVFNIACKLKSSRFQITIAKVGCIWTRCIMVRNVNAFSNSCLWKTRIRGLIWLVAHSISRTTSRLQNVVFFCNGHSAMCFFVGGRFFVAKNLETYWWGENRPQKNLWAGEPFCGLWTQGILFCPFLFVVLNSPLD